MGRIRPRLGVGVILLAALVDPGAGRCVGPEIRHQNGIRLGQCHRMLVVLPNAIGIVPGLSDIDFPASSSGIYMRKFMWKQVESAMIVDYF